VLYEKNGRREEEMRGDARRREKVRGRRIVIRIDWEEIERRRV
jgi:hypothetical protein